MNSIIWIIFGAITGWVASIIKGRNARMGVLTNLIVGVVGAFIGGLAMNAFGFQGVTGFNITSLVVAVLGAVVLLFLTGFVNLKNTKDLIKSAPEKQSSILPKIQQEMETKEPPATSASKAAPQKIQQEIEMKSPSTTLARKIDSGIIFISYRRTDSADVTGRIYDRLVGGFGKTSVFKDVDSIPLGFDFKEYLDEKVSECNVLLAIVGDRWLEARDSRGRSRLEDSNDFVRIEIESALARGIPVIPLLVQGARMPSEEELPNSLKKLAYRNGTPIRPDPDFHRDMDRLISALKQYVEPQE